MAESNEGWGNLAEHDPELANVWDSFDTLPEPGVNPMLDAFVERKHVSIQALLKLGAKLAEYDVLAFEYGTGIKYRNVSTGRMWSYLGSTWPTMKVVRAGAEPTSRIIVCEGESDGARLTQEYDVDVGIMPGGAKHFPESMGKQLEPYAEVLIGLDKDESGELGTEKIAAQHGNTQRFLAPGDGDWADAEELPPLPDESLESEADESLDLSSELLVPAGTMMDMEVPDIASWLEHALLPIGGQLLLHGWAKSFKSFTAFDMLARLSQGQDWCGFEPTEEACRVAVVQFEIAWAYYYQRIQQLLLHAPEPDLMKENFFTFTPMQRPNLLAGNTQSEDVILNALVANSIQIVLVDPIRRATGSADLNAENEVRRMLHFFQRIQDQGISVVATHHDNKAGAHAGGGSTLSMTGSGAFAGDADSILSIETVRGDNPDTSPRRNVNFALRNAPALGPRSFEIQDDGAIQYDTGPIDREADAEPEGDERIVAPSV